MLFGLLLVLGLIICIAWLLKRSGLTPNMQASAAARVVGGVSVGNRERVVVVEIADQWIVVGVAPGRVNALATMPKQESPATLADDARPARNFSSWMKQTIEKRNASR
ncbi:flagellar biosynthetic protein FliO [Oxalobacteraceae bacterium CAVE-383]|nr:flagellar biosynthetic protein FliO [Oxalobacteraceae bacterium CAVE-383]